MTIPWNKKDLFPLVPVVPDVSFFMSEIEGNTTFAIFKVCVNMRSVSTRGLEMDQAKQFSDDRSQLRKMRYASLLEGTTLLLLLGVAVPLKHLGGCSGLVSIMGPTHGLVFLLYFWMLVQTLSNGDWTRGDALRMTLAALVPFGAFVNERALARRAVTLSTSA
ncbi:DUF3817 domain-containing protein [Duganella vulcania]|nr:DUF3817 domain-containing protein [Duganella vulcania]